MTDKEKSASPCIKTIRDIVPYQTDVLGDELQPSLALIQHIFDQIQSVVMGPHNSMPGMSPSGSSENSPQPDISAASISDPLLQAIASLKALNVLAECPTISESRIQVCKSWVSQEIKHFFLFIKSVLLLQVEHQKQNHTAAAKKETIIFTKVSLNISNKPAFGELIKTQIKALSTLACLFQYSNKKLLKLTKFNKFHPILPCIIIQLLKYCPRGKLGVRKELLITTRNIIHFNFGKLFLEHINELLDERTFIS